MHAGLPGRREARDIGRPLSVVIGTVDRPEGVRAVVRQCVAQMPARAELVVVDQSRAAYARDNAAWLARLADPRVRHLVRDRRGLPRARNEGVSASIGDVVLFFDDDVTLHPGCIAAHLAVFRDPTVGGVVGRILEERLRPNACWTTNRVGPGGRVLTRLDGPDPCWVDTLKGANMSLRRTALEQAGGFDPGFAGTALLEDADLSVRVRHAGWRLRYEPDAAVVHHHAPTGGVRQGGVDGREAERWRFHNTARFVRKHRGWAGLVPLAVTFGAIASLRAVQWRDPRPALGLLASLVAGWRSSPTT